MTARPRLEGLDALRGFAAFAVVLFHFVGFIPLFEIPTGAIGDLVVRITRFGHLGVPVFFALSGFVIALTAERYTFTPSLAGRFLARRLVRIAPPYWAMIAVLALTIIGGHRAGLFLNTSLDLAQVGAHLVYLQNILDFTPLDVAYWTLCLEVQFYVVFAIIGVLCPSSPPWRTMLITLLTLGSFGIDCAQAVPQAYFPRLWYHFGLGVLAFDATRRLNARWILYATAVAVLTGGIVTSDNAMVSVAVVSVALPRVCGVIGVPRPILGLGAVSYSLYLVHGWIGWGLGAAFRAGLGRTERSAWILIAGGVLASLAAATLLYWLVERRAVTLSHRVRVDRH